MERIISGMLKEYECGHLSRRHLIRGLSALTLVASPAPAAESTFKGVGLNHIAIRVADHHLVSSHLSDGESRP